MVIESLNKNGEAVVYKQILHNDVLIQDLKNRGANFVDEITQLNHGDKVILRAHGEEKSVYDYLKDNNIEYSH